MASVRAKFRCNGINLRQGHVKVGTENGVDKYETIDLPTVIMNPVYAGPDASEEDKAFWESSPNGKLEMQITNHRAAEFFQLGETYYLTFEAAGASD